MTDPALPKMPYVEFVLSETSSGNERVREAWSRNLHWGYWACPEAADVSVSGYARAQDELTRRHFTEGGVASGQRIADVGCGLGGALALLNESFDELDLVGLNIDERQLARARANVTPRAGSGNRVEFVLGDACALPFPDRSIDVVLSVECIFHFASKQRYFAEVKRVLKPGGRLVVSDFVARSWALPLVVLLFAFFRSGVRDTYGEAGLPPTRALYQRLARGAGLELVSTLDVTHNTLPNYEVLPMLVEGTSSEATFKSGVRFLEYATKLGFYSYDLLTFRA
jgi:ubiquinone/menaquinone biosynthesis C-methylase UbiE